MQHSPLALLRSAAALALLVGSAPSFATVGELRAWDGPAAAPTLSLLTPAGLPISLTELRGKVVLVNFWATWCEPCVAEMPVLQKLQREFSRQGFEVLGVNYKEGPARIDAFINKHSIRFPVVRDDDGATAKAWGAQVFPASFLIDRAGRRRYFCVGDADWTSLKMMNTIRALIAEPKQ